MSFVGLRTLYVVFCAIFMSSEANGVQDHTLFVDNVKYEIAQNFQRQALVETQGEFTQSQSFVFKSRELNSWIIVAVCTSNVPNKKKSGGTTDPKDLFQNSASLEDAYLMWFENKDVRILEQDVPDFNVTELADRVFDLVFYKSVLNETDSILVIIASAQDEGAPEKASHIEAAQQCFTRVAK